MNSDNKYKSFLPWKNLPPDNQEYRPDDRSGALYLEDEKLRFVTEVAIVTQRPLLLRGEPGSGKSSFAPFVARNLNWRYYEHTVTGRTEARDLLWRFDVLRRLRDARQGADDIPARQYVSPGPLWWAFNRAEALDLANLSGTGKPESEPSSSEPFADMNHSRDEFRAVVLIDEIDKADPNVPNDLLEVLSTNQFRVEEADILVTRKFANGSNDASPANQYGTLLTVITTNEERDLPAAFLRRCVVHTISEPDTLTERSQRLMYIALLHMRPLIEERPEGSALLEQIALKCLNLRDEARSKQRRGPSIAEFLDAIRFCLVRGLDTNSEEWRLVQQSVFLK